MEQQVGQVVQKMVDKPTDAWMATLPILFIALVLGVILFAYMLWRKSADDSTKREERLTGIIDTTLKEHGQTISRQTDALVGINASMLLMNNELCKVSYRVDEIEDVLKIKGA